MIPPERKRICPKAGHLIEYPSGSGPSPDFSAWLTGLVVNTEGICLHILCGDGTIIKGVRRDTVRVIG
jgi:hypothetical protein